MEKAVLVTGACVNTGVAIVERFAREGRNVIFTGRNKERVLIAEKEYNKKYSQVKIKGYAIDSLLDERTVNESAVLELFEKLDAQNIFIECLVLNAADLGLGMKIFENPLTDFMRVINTNIVWNYLLAEQAAKRMKEQGGGSIVFINSNTAHRAIPDRIAYEASKGGQLGMMRGLAIDLGKYNIRVNAVLPGLIKTDRWEKNPEAYDEAPTRYSPLGKIITGADIADAVWYFAVNAENTTGSELVVDGGNMIQLYPIMPKR